MLTASPPLSRRAQETRKEGMSVLTPKTGISLWIAPHASQGNALKHFMGHLKLKSPRARFSHADVHTTLHRELSIVENLLMAAEESLTDETYDVKEAILNSRLESENLRVLASWFKNPRRKTDELSAQEKFMAAVCFALLRPADETFIDMGQVSLDRLCVAHLQKLVQEKSHGRHITVRLGDKSSWEVGFDQELIMTPDGLKFVA